MRRREAPGMGKQLVVRVDNRPGSISRLFHELALRSVNVEHTAGVSAGVVGLVVLTVSDDAAARTVLEAEGYEFEEGESFVVRVEDRPGALAEATELLASAGVNVSSVLEVGRHGGWVDLAFTVDDRVAAKAAIEGSEIVSVSWGSH